MAAVHEFDVITVDSTLSQETRLYYQLVFDTCGTNSDGLLTEEGREESQKAWKQLKCENTFAMPRHIYTPQEAHRQLESIKRKK